MAHMGETYDRNLRVTSMYSRTIYAQLEQICDNMDFNHPRFINKAKRNRSIGSAQAFVVELALTDEQFLAKLRKFMMNGGRDFKSTIVYTDRYF
jgi:hypothetical protein